jgi:anti-sigma B factor antagonist
MAEFDETRTAGELRVLTEQNGNALVVTASGEIDMASCGRLDEELRRALANGASSIELDLSQVTFIDSTGVAVLLKAVALSRQDRKRLSIRQELSQAVRRTFEVAGLVDRLPLA